MSSSGKSPTSPSRDSQRPQSLPLSIPERRVASSPNNPRIHDTSVRDLSPASGTFAHAYQSRQTPELDVFDVAVSPSLWNTNGYHRQVLGYTSEPMSRDMSYRSEVTHFSDSLVPPRPDDDDDRLTRYVLDSSAHRNSLSTSPAFQNMQRPRSRRPSIVETEPSPNIPGFAGSSFVVDQRSRSPVYISASPDKTSSGNSRNDATPIPTGSLPY
ncbi:hypothetical protein Micbo1qcDRAFT_164779, partial [Microdochium bolleyi]